MVDTIGDTMPWLHSKLGKGPAKTAETTPGGKKNAPMVVVVKNVNPGEAAVIKARLESENIPTIVQQEAMGSVLGLTVGPLGSAKILVPEPLAEKALAILAETFDDDEPWEEETC